MGNLSRQAQSREDASGGLGASLLWNLLPWVPVLVAFLFGGYPAEWDPAASVPEVGAPGSAARRPSLQQMARQPGLPERFLWALV